MNKYWLVHKNNIKYFPNLNQSKIDFWTNMIIEKNDEFIFIGTFTNDNYGYMLYNEQSLIYFKHNNYIYEGEFLPIKKIRKNKLSKINENR